MTKRTRMMGAIAGLLLLSILVSACGTTVPVAADWPGLTVAGVTYQVTIDGKPLYHYAKDAATGDVNGQGKGGSWFVVQVSSPVTAPASGEHPTVMVGSSATLGNILVDGEGMTLYTYAQDTANTSNCGADCTPTWPPLAIAEGTVPTPGQGVTGTLGVIERADSIVYVISGSPEAVVLLDAEGGEQDRFAASSEAKGTFYWSPVTLGGDLAFVGFGVPESKIFGLYAFDPRTGEPRWSVAADSTIMAAPAYDEKTGTVYFGTTRGQVYAVDVPKDTSEAGTLKSDSWPVALDNNPEAIWGSPLVAGGNVYVPSLDHHVYCLDGVTGQQKWAFATRGAVAAQPTLSLDGKVLYFGDFAGRVYAVEVDTGQEITGFNFQAGNWIWSEVLVTAERLYVTAMDGKLYAVAPDTGETLAVFDPAEGTGHASSALRAAPVELGDNIILVASEAGYVTALNTETGKKIWSWPDTGTPSAQVLTTPVVMKASAGTDAPDTVYVVLLSGKVYALEADRGSKAWEWPEPSP